MNWKDFVKGFGSVVDIFGTTPIVVFKKKNKSINEILVSDQIKISNDFKKVLGIKHNKYVK